MRRLESSRWGVHSLRYEFSIPELRLAALSFARRGEGDLEMALVRPSQEVGANVPVTFEHAVRGA